MAGTIANGFAPIGLVDYHGITDQKGYVEHVGEQAQRLGDKQELKKGIAVITEYKDYVTSHYAYLANQRSTSMTLDDEVESS